MSGQRRRGTASPGWEARRRGAESGRAAWLLVGVYVLVLGTDQVTKWWAWRHLDGAVINDGGYILLGSARWWFAEPVPGAVANVVGAALVAAGLAVLLRHPRRTAVQVGGALLAAGWTSNLFDRFGLHRWTAPDSARGVVDFIPSGGASRCNIADLWILVGLVLLGLALAGRHRSQRSSAAPGSSR
jgi:lipoprotein signal peptidase